MRRLATTDGKTFYHRAFELPPLGPTEVRIKVAFASPKHGTEAHVIAGSVFDAKRWDPDLRLFLPKVDGAPAQPPKERGVGNMVVGVVDAVGERVTRVAIGDAVFGSGPIAEFTQAGEASWHPRGELGFTDCVSVDPAHVALVAVRDGNIRIGDSVAVFGLGAIGLMSVQIARASGARKVYGVDPVALRRQVALRYGADAVFDPASVDAALEIKLATEKRGVDVAIETSGNGRALHESIRCLRQCGTVVHVPWGPKDASTLRLDEEFHLNRPTLIASQAWAGWANPDRSHPLWDHARAYAAAIELLRAKVISGEGVVHPIVKFEEAQARFSELFADPTRAIKLGVAF